MSSSLVSMLSYALLPAITMIAGGLIAAWKAPGPSLRSAILHFAAGVVFAVVAVELLPDIVRVHAPVAVIIGFALGIVVMLGIRWLSERSEKKQVAAAESSIGMLTGIGVDIFIDGLLIGIGFAAGSKERRLLTFALTVELLSLGLATSAAMGQNRASRQRAIGTTVVLALVFAASAIVGVSVLQGLSGTILAVVLSFGSAALLFLVTEELLVEAHEEPETLLLTATFFVGFLAFLVLGMLG